MRGLLSIGLAAVASALLSAACALTTAGQRCSDLSKHLSIPSRATIES